MIVSGSGALMCGVGLFVMKMLGIFDLVDQVWDDTDALIVKNRKEQDRIPLASVVNVNHAACNPERITLKLRQPCGFGSEVVFMPPTRWRLLSPFSTHPLAEELIERVDVARRDLN